MSSMPYMHCPP